MNNLYHGIDVSQYQGKIDFSKVKKQGIDFVMIRAGYGKYSSQKDPCFEDNYKGAKSAGINVGAYWYSYATNKEEAVIEAETFLETIKGKTFEYPIALDIEDKCITNLSNETVNAIIDAFCSVCEKAGYYVCVYSYASFLNSRVWENTKKKYDIWVAHYGVKNPDYTGNYGMWQYSSKGKIPGIETDVDINYSYVNYPSIIKKAGLNGIKSEKVLDKTGYKKNDKGLGVYALKQLVKIAYRKKIITVKVQDNNLFGAFTEKAVNEFLKKQGYAQNGIAGENFVKKLGEKL